MDEEIPETVVWRWADFCRFYCSSCKVKCQVWMPLVARFSSQVLRGWKSFLYYHNHLSGTCGLRLVALEVPSTARVGEELRLLCLYDLEHDTLYSMKVSGWFDCDALESRDLTEIRLVPYYCLGSLFILSFHLRIYKRRTRMECAKNVASHIDTHHRPQRQLLLKRYSLI